MTTDPKRAIELACVLARVSDARPHCIAEVVRTLQAVAVAHKRGAERRCNEALSEAEEACLTRREAGAAERASLALAGLVPVATAQACFGGDPRGACGCLKVEGAPGDGWGSDGWPLY